MSRTRNLKPLQIPRKQDLTLVGVSSGASRWTSRLTKQRAPSPSLRRSTESGSRTPRVRASCKTAREHQSDRSRRVRPRRFRLNNKQRNLDLYFQRARRISREENTTCECRAHDLPSSQQLRHRSQSESQPSNNNERLSQASSSCWTKLLSGVREGAQRATEHAPTKVLCFSRSRSTAPSSSSWRRPRSEASAMKSLLTSAQ